MKYILFTADPQEARRAWNAGIQRVLVDWETRGKYKRQHGYHLECNYHTVEDLKRIRAVYPGELVCRINPVGPGTDQEIEMALDHGADMIMLPMFRGAYEVEKFLRYINDRCKTILLVERKEAVETSGQWYNFPFTEFYLGLNDLTISYHKKFCYELICEDLPIFQSLPSVSAKPFGIGGLTILGAGQPLPSMMILMEIVRLGATRVILRRSFKRDVAHKDWPVEIENMNQYIEKLSGRSDEQKRADQRMVSRFIQEIAGNLPQGGNP